MFATQPKVAKKMADGMKKSNGGTKSSKHPLKGLPKKKTSVSPAKTRAAWKKEAAKRAKKKG